MSIALTLLVTLPVLKLLAYGMLSDTLASSRSGDADVRTRRTVSWLMALQTATALAACAFGLVPLLQGAPPFSVEIIPAVASVYLDGFSLLMAGLVAFVGLVVSRYSIRYLDGDAEQARFFRRLAVTIAGISLFVIAGNLIMQFAAWLLANWGLHRLLTHYVARPAAQRAARTRLVITFIGDALMLAAVLLIYRLFGTTEIKAIFTELQNGGAADTWVLPLIAWLVALSALTKSVQFPFHAWLPNTLEAPTPVSAIMHAGIVNAGGYLVIRLSPLLVASPTALAGLAIIGSLTIGFAGTVMLTQTSVKRSLAFSTIAQMGFMIVQCGLGAFSAAMLHILAHSLYKAYAFLNSGSVLTEAAGREVGKPPRLRTLSALDYAAGLIVAAVTVSVGGLLMGINFAQKPGGIALGIVLTLAITTWLWNVFRFDSIRTTFLGLAAAFGLCGLYLVAFASVHQLVAASMPPIQIGLPQTVATADVIVLFSGLLCLSRLLYTQRGRVALAPLYVHAASGFYVDAWTRRVFAISKR